MTLKELKLGLMEIMQTRFPKSKYKYYSMAVMENYERPCFFTQIKPIDEKPENHNSRSHQLVLYITYFQKKADESEMLDVIQELEDLFGLCVKIGDKSVNVMSFDWNYVGTDRNVPEIAVELQYLTKIERQETAPVMEQVILKKEMEE